LYVDDDHANRVVFEQSLMYEFAIRTAPDAAEALRLLDEFDVAVVLADMRMPNMSGDELLRIVRERHPRTMRMVVTAFTDIDPILKAINDGLVSRYLIKPWQREEMLLCLRWGVENWRFGKDAEELQRRLVETERLATLGLLAGMFAHDVKTPLVSAMLNHDIAMSSVVPRLESMIAGAALDPHTSSQLVELIGDLRATHDIVQLGLDTAKMFLEAMRDFTRPIKDDNAPTEADPLAIVRHSVTVCQSIAQANHAQIDMRMPSVMPNVRMNPVSLTQVLCNLLSNAAQAVHERGLKNGMVSVAARVRPDEIELRVSDQGVGMAPEILKRVGTPFFTTKTEGQGLGLAQCQRLVGSAGGRLQIESEPGVGTTVTVILPTAA
jgi:signal transduction histidine kinase